MAKTRRRVAFISQYREEPHHSQIIARQMTPWMRAQAQSRGFFVWSSARLLGTHLDIVLLARPPGFFLEEREGASRDLVEQVLCWAALNGYSDIGLGSLVASVTDGGRKLLPLARDLGLRLDHGDDMSCALAWRQACALESCGLDLSRSTVAVVGGAGVMGAGFARLIARQVHRLILVVRSDDMRAQRLAAVLRRSALGLQVEVATDFQRLRQADLVYVAHNSLTDPIRPAQLKQGAVVLDACVPPAVHERDFGGSGQLVLSSGCGVLPRSFAPRGVGADLGLGYAAEGPIVYGCMLGTALAASEAFGEHRLGAVDEGYARDIVRLGELLSVRHQPFEMFGRRLSPQVVRSFLLGGWEMWAKAS